jgi:thiol-disulfide isomerase/thioredoxin
MSSSASRSVRFFRPAARPTSSFLRPYCRFSRLSDLFDLLAYTVGLCLALLVIAFVGQKILEKLGVASDPYGWFKRTLGLIFILVGLAIFFGQDRIFEAKLLDSGVFDITKVEQVLLGKVTSPQTNQLATSTPTVASSTVPVSTSYVPTDKERVMRKAQLYPKAPELVNPSGFVNTDGKPIKLSDYIGKKVILLDVWTYSCINCQRTLPYVKAWYDKYKDQGLEIIGLHTPEFSFEKVQKNVEDAVKRDGITYPVVLDNDYATWNAYGNQYWPRKYLIDLDGYIVYDHIGEGDYDVTEQAIQKALEERASILKTPMAAPETTVKPKDVINFDQGKVGSPETYFGAMRNVYLGNGKPAKMGEQNFTQPSSGTLNTLYLGGTWDIQNEYAATKSPDATVIYAFNSKNVYMVASAPTATDVEVWIDGVKTKTVTIHDEKLYTLVEGKDYGQHTLLLKIHNPGLKAFTFTFG